MLNFPPFYKKQKASQRVRPSGKYERTDGAGVGTGVWVVPAYGDGYEYIYAEDSPAGKLYIRFHGVQVSASTVACAGIDTLIDYQGNMNGNTCYHGYSGDGSSYFWLQAGVDIVTFNGSGWGADFGSFVYTRS